MTYKKMPADVIEALRGGTPIKDEKLEALTSYTCLLIDKRGHLEDKELQAFLSAGYMQRQALEVLVGLASKTDFELYEFAREHGARRRFEAARLGAPG